MLKPLRQWICDTCGELIQSPEEGYLEWIESTGDIPAHSFKIVHHLPHSPLWSDERRMGSGCYQHSDSFHKLDLSLKRFDGQYGIALLLAWIDVGRFHQPEYQGVTFKDGREFAELFRRLKVPYYEEARLYIHKAMHDGVIEGVHEVALYEADTLKRIIREYSQY